MASIAFSRGPNAVMRMTRGGDSRWGAFSHALLGWTYNVLGDFARSEGERMDRELQSKLAPPMKVNTPNKEAFIKASGEVYEEFGKQVAGGAQLIKTVQSLR